MIYLAQGTTRNMKNMSAAVWRLAAILILAVSIGCSESTSPPPEPPPAKFDPRSADFTFQWLIQVATPVSAERGNLRRQHFANPLRKDFEAEDAKIESKWEKAVAGIHGKKVVWPAVVKKISEVGLYVDGWPSGYSVYNGDYHLYLEFEGGMTSRPTYGGFLPLGKSVTLEDARKLLPNDWIFVSGTI